MVWSQTILCILYIYMIMTLMIMKMVIDFSHWNMTTYPGNIEISGLNYTGKFGWVGQIQSTHILYYIPHLKTPVI